MLGSASHESPTLSCRGGSVRASPLFLVLSGCDKAPSEPGAGSSKPAESAKAESPAVQASAPAAVAPPASSPAPAPEPKASPRPPDVAAPPADAKKTASGLASKVLHAGHRQGAPEVRTTS